MKKLFILIIPILLLCGCDNEEINYEKYIDKDTCVVYLSRYYGGITPMYNTDNTLKLDNECLESKGEIKWQKKN